ncbi:hypothetical protein [Roseobacter sp. TSBP12]|uniref:hypothetical protein n=1 Tax=Roseobacter sp. TSBP12 TaxID=1236613 RepID=UPI00125F077D|nr:hypothetical protein [Roseobacter sp. TSBP12]KAB6716274.1 hypothetical protein C8029_10350 [Roseobacter sp. TSBP12]
MSVFLSTQPDPEAMMSALDREVIHKAFMLEMDFASGPVRVSDWSVPFIAGGYEWEGLGDLVGMSEIGGGSELAPYREYQLGLPKDLVGYSEARIPELIGNRADYLGRSARLWMQIFDPVSLDEHGRRVPLGDPITMDYGIMSRVIGTFVPGGAVVSLTVEGGLFRAGVPLSGYYTDRDQQRRHPEDLGLGFVVEVSDTEIKLTDW